MKFKKLDIFNPPPSGVELLVLNPNGLVQLSHWRHGYSIFTCQSKGESTDGWYWKEINLEKEDE